MSANKCGENNPKWVPKVCVTCEQCGSPFEVLESRLKYYPARFCSLKCSNEWKKTGLIGKNNPNSKDLIIKICKNCNKEFGIRQGRINRGEGIFCSRECHFEWMRKNKIGKKPNKKHFVCAFCGKDFLSFPGSNRKYCSMSCKYKDSRVVRKKICEYCGNEFISKRPSSSIGKYCSHECHMNAMRRTVLRNCKYCGKEFYVKPSTVFHSGAVFCSKRCQFDWMSENMRGENSPGWKGGLSFGQYCPKFSSEFKERVREFFGRKCVECGKTEEENGRKLSVHHVNYDKNTCCHDGPALFVATCVYHNTKANTDRKLWQKHYTDIINEKYGGKCYFTREEMQERKMKNESCGV